MSNISKVSLLIYCNLATRSDHSKQEHFKVVQSLDLPWDTFKYIFASGEAGMRKPDLCSFQYMAKRAGCLPREMLLIDDTVENICAARSIGMHGILVDSQFTRSGGALRNMFQLSVPRGKAFLNANAGSHHCVVEGHNEIVLKDNFAQLMIWELTGDASLIYLKWPSGKVTGIPNGKNLEPNGLHIDRQNIRNGLWNYFCEAPVLTTTKFPPDADTTTTAYLSLPAEYLDDVTDVKVVLDEIVDNIDRNGITQTYFDAERPRTTPEVCCNILRAFHHYGYGSDPRLAATERWVVDCLKNKACLDGNRHYSTLEGFLYFVARLYAICKTPLKKELEIVKDELIARLNEPVNPLGLAIRLAACQFAEIEPSRYRRDLELMMSLQDEDGGWPAGHFCCIGRTGARIGNRGLTTAFALKVIEGELREGRL